MSINRGVGAGGAMGVNTMFLPLLFVKILEKAGFLAWKQKMLSKGTVIIYQEGAGKFCCDVTV